MRHDGMMVRVGLVMLAGAAATSWGDPYDPPPSYYAGAVGTGITLKAQLTAAMSDGHIQRNYGQFRYSAVLHDADPDLPGNILLAYNRASVSGAWDSGATWNREHVWPDSRQPGSASNSSTGNLGDPHALRPCNPSINSSRGNKPFGLSATTGGYGHEGSYYFPGDADKGDIARSLFYSDTRWTSLGLSLVNTFPSGYQMGELDALVVWNYVDPPDTFERRRNHVIYSQAENPVYFTGNRNAYIDNPWFVWSIYVDQMNDSQVHLGSPAGDGSSTLVVDLGEVLVGDVPAAGASVTIHKSGVDGTYFEVAADPGATASIAGKYNAFALGGADSRDMDISLDSPDTSASGTITADIVIDNLDITVDGGAGRGANDGDDVITLVLDVLDHANASFHPVTDQDVLVLDLGAITQGSGDAVAAFDLYNLLPNPGWVAALDVDPDGASGDTGVLTTTLGTVTALGSSQSFLASMDDATTGSFSATYTFRTWDDRTFATALEGAAITLMLTGSVEPIECVGDFNSDLVVDFDDLNEVLLGWGTPYDFDDLNLVLLNWLDDCTD